MCGKCGLEACGDCGEPPRAGSRGDAEQRRRWSVVKADPGPARRDRARKGHHQPYLQIAAKTGPFNETIKNSFKPCSTYAKSLRELHSFDDYEYKESYDKYLKTATASVTCGKCEATMNVSQYAEHLSVAHKRHPLQLSCIWCDDQNFWERFAATSLMFEHMFLCLQSYVRQQNNVK
ncbi:hypothetical protein chmu148 [Choristoneura murinana nucleopolyhedrovirus]|uniref:Uncharacterized protein n=1 Tax=Choristoneura murinana nucleopolyhedrovirus TaxID=1987479 RepID=V9XVJ9_9ABAC|nr:hypothetical protein chmu148 [Choristoneura murinana nucleopolyhedrovirus]AHD25633.1 hypothetical protein chmu148 [Choristoneura murinana nucleopolyhedrovirus]